jgi:hypothetical protein
MTPPFRAFCDPSPLRGNQPTATKVAAAETNSAAEFRPPCARSPADEIWGKERFKNLRSDSVNGNFRRIVLINPTPKFEEGRDRFAHVVGRSAS